MTGGITGLFLLFKNLFMVDQYIFGAVSVLSNFELNLAGDLAFDSTNNFIYPLT